MSSLASLVSLRGVIRFGDEGDEVMAVQIALRQAGYRIGNDGEFGPGTRYAVQRFQRQHGLRDDGIVGPLTAALLDAPHTSLVETSKPEVIASGKWPNDDTASLLAFYGRPWLDSDLITKVPVPFPMTYEGRPVSHIPFHKKAAAALTMALDLIAAAAKDNPSVLRHVSKWSGAGNYRTVRGSSSRLSVHAFWAATDFDAENLPLGRGVPPSEMPTVVVTSFKVVGAFWGGDYVGRKDPMHFQFAHE